MPLSVLEILEHRANTFAASRAYALLDGSEEAESLTFFELYRRARAIGARLQQHRLRGERALLLYPPGTEYITAFYGCLASGTVAIPAYPPRMNRNVQRLEAILEDACPRVALTTGTVFRQMRRQVEESPLLSRLTWILTDEVNNEEADTWVDPRVDSSTLAFLQYTSASTAQPKGVMVTNGNILHNELLQKEAVQHNAETVMVSWLPLFHDMGLISVVLASLYNGVPCYLLSPVDFLKRPLSWLEAITRYRGTFSGAPDFGYQLCVDRIAPADREKLDLSSWRVAFNGSEPVRASTLERFSKAFAGCGFRSEALYPCYGLAENTLFATGGFYRGPKAFSRSSFEAHRPQAASNGHEIDASSQSAKLVHCGTPLLDSKVRIVNTDSSLECASDEIGEIWLSSPSVAEGYWNQPEMSQAIFGARLPNGEGPFLRTGDLGFFDDGQLYVTGRLKDLIIIRGRNLVPQDIELAIEQCDPAIRPAFVAAVSMEANGSERLAVAAEVRREDRRGMDAEALVTRIRSAIVTEFSVDVSAVALLRPNSLPKTSSGKTQRAKVRQKFFDGLDGTLFSWKDEAVFSEAITPRAAATRCSIEQIERWLRENIATRAKLPAHRIDLDTALSGFGLDSVEAVAFGCEVEEKFSIHFQTEVLFDGQPTVREIARHILTEQSVSVKPRVTVPLLQPVATNGNRVHSNATHPTPGETEPVLAAFSVTTRNGSAPYETRNTNGTLHSDATKNGSGMNGFEQIGLNGNGAGHWSHLEEIRIVEPILSIVVNGHDGAPPKRTPSSLPIPHPSRPEGSMHPYRAHVNPELGRALTQMGMDKTFVRGEGSWLWDENGRRYLDFLAQYGALPFGFNPPRIWQALYSVCESGEPSFVQPSCLDAAGELARRLLAVLPRGMAYVTFGNSGAEAAEAAIKLCRSTTGRMGILSATNGFHGKTLGALSATAKPKYQKSFGAPVEGFDYVAYGDAEALRRTLSSRRYAGFLVEPIQAEGGIIEPPAGYLRQARKICRDTGTLFVADEIQTGMGRTGAMFVCGELGITPDIILLAKALGGGLMPIGACVSTAEAYNADFALKHTSTFAGNTLSCRAGIASLDLLEENDRWLISQVAANGARLKQELIELRDKYPGLIGEVRGRGYLLGLSFALNRNSVERGLLGYLGEQEALTALVVSHLLDVESVRVGYTLNQGGVMRIEPPLTATWDECSHFLQALERALIRLNHADAAALTAQVTGYEVPIGLTISTSAPVRKQSRPKIAIQPEDGRFAFLVHPLAWSDYADLDESLSPLSEKQLASLSTAFADNFDPMVIGETRITGANGKSAYGEFILVPRRADELKAMPREEALSEIRQAVRLGQERGARIVGLGAYTSVVSQGGMLLKGNEMPPLTTGNSFTAAAARQTVRLAAAERGWSLSNCVVAVIGAGGAVGQALSILLAQEAGSLILLGNPAHPHESLQRLQQVVGRIAQSISEAPWSASPGSVGEAIAKRAVKSASHDTPGQDRNQKDQIADRTTLLRLGEDLLQHLRSLRISVDLTPMLREADIVISCTNTTERMIREQCLRPSAVVCDIARPSNVCDQVRGRRRDVSVIDGGVIRLPGNASLGFNTNLAKGHAYACMVETFMLAMEHRYRDMSLGFDLPLGPVLELERLAVELGFEVVTHRKDTIHKIQSEVDVSESLELARA